MRVRMGRVDWKCLRRLSLKFGGFFSIPSAHASASLHTSQGGQETVSGMSLPVWLKRRKRRLSKRCFVFMLERTCFAVRGTTFPSKRTHVHNEIVFLSICSSAILTPHGVNCFSTSSDLPPPRTILQAFIPFIVSFQINVLLLDLNVATKARFAYYVGLNNIKSKV